MRLSKKLFTGVLLGLLGLGLFSCKNDDPDPCAGVKRPGASFYMESGSSSPRMSNRLRTENFESVPDHMFEEYYRAMERQDTLMGLHHPVTFVARQKENLKYELRISGSDQVFTGTNGRIVVKMPQVDSGRIRRYTATLITQVEANPCLAEAQQYDTTIRDFWLYNQKTDQHLHPLVGTYKGYTTQYPDSIVYLDIYLRRSGMGGLAGTYFPRFGTRIINMVVDTTVFDPISMGSTWDTFRKGEYPNLNRSGKDDPRNHYPAYFGWLSEDKQQITVIYETETRSSYPDPLNPRDEEKQYFIFEFKGDRIQ
jgi:hypothetical protein